MAMAWEDLTVAFAKGKKGSGCELGGWVRAGLPIPHTQITLYIYIYLYEYIYICGQATWSCHSNGKPWEIKFLE